MKDLPVSKTRAAWPRNDTESMDNSEPNGTGAAEVKKDNPAVFRSLRGHATTLHFRAQLAAATGTTPRQGPRVTSSWGAAADFVRTRN